jgi:hypothetical protein
MSSDAVPAADPRRLRFESVADRQIREAMARGEFTGLPGAGKPIDGLGDHHDDDWWIKAKLRREQLSYLPPTLALRREVELGREAIARARSEDVVRRIVADLNARILEINRTGGEGPPSTLMPLQVETVVRDWRAARDEA